jgi:hypothetical protein
LRPGPGRGNRRRRMSEHLLDHLDVGAARDREAGCVWRSWCGYRSGTPIALAPAEKPLRKVLREGLAVADAWEDEVVHLVMGRSWCSCLLVRGRTPVATTWAMGAHRSGQVRSWVAAGSGRPSLGDPDCQGVVPQIVLIGLAFAANAG